MPSPLKPVILAALLAGLCLTAVGPARAHPHVWIEAVAEVLFDSQGRVTGIRHAWTFDEAYSAFATTGLDSNRDGRFSREELADLAKVNVESLEEFGYFTVVKAGGKPAAAGKPEDYWLEHADARLRLHFTLPLAAPVSGRTVHLEVSDPTFFVSFSFAPGDAVRLAAAPRGCSVRIRRAQQSIDQTEAARLGETLVERLSQAASPFLDQFTNRATVACA